MIAPLGPMSPATSASPPFASTSARRRIAAVWFSSATRLSRPCSARRSRLHAERVGHDDLRARLEVAAVDAADELRLRDVPCLGRIAELQPGREQHRAHRAVGDDHGVGRRRAPATPRPGRRRRSARRVATSGNEVVVDRAGSFERALELASRSHAGRVPARSVRLPRFGTMAGMTEPILRGERVVLRPANDRRRRAPAGDPRGAVRRPLVGPAAAARRRRGVARASRTTTWSSSSSSMASSSAASSTARRTTPTTGTPASTCS